MLVVIAEGDADAGHYDPVIHALCLGAPERFQWLRKRYSGNPDNLWLYETDEDYVPPPDPLMWTADNMAEAVAAYLELDGSTDENLCLATELSKHCSIEAADRLLDAIEDALARLEQEDAEADAQARAEVAASGLDWDTCLRGLAWAV